MAEKLKTYAVIAAAGSGSRFGADIPKQFIKTAGKTILEHTIAAFEKSVLIDEIIIVITPEYRHNAEEIIKNNNYKKVSKLVNGGKIRKESSYLGIKAIPDKEAYVLIHDCARPLVSQKIIKDCIDALKKYDAVCTAVQVSDTILEINENNIISNVPDRSCLMRAQTPQGFRLSLIKNAHETAENDACYTDDCGLIVKSRLADVHIIEGSSRNIKITYPEDIYTAEKLLSEMQ